MTARSGFLNLDEFPAARALADDLCGDASDLTQEAVSLVGEHFMAWPEDINGGGWEVLGVKWQGRMIGGSFAHRAVAIVERHPATVNAGYSLMKPGTEIVPHVGYTSDVVRLHVGLLVPHSEDCALVVGGEARRWRHGEPFLFDDTVLHSAHNRTQEGRIIFLADIRR